jgi:histidine triad (HIT) family protein
MASDPNCIFCKIVAGQVPCWKVYEDARVLAFLDVGPLSEGHTLVIPKAHAAMLDELSAEDGAAIGAVLPRLARAVKEATGAAGYNVLQNNGKVAHQAVGHVHFHIIPRGGAIDGFGLKWNAFKLDAEAAKKLLAAVVEKLT